MEKQYADYCLREKSSTVLGHHQTRQPIIGPQLKTTTVLLPLLLLLLLLKESTTTLQGSFSTTITHKISK